MKQNAAIYARVSSDRQKEEKTIASQTALLREYGQEHGYGVPPEWIFEDEGYSGATLVRPGLERLRDLVAEGQVEVILIYAPDRLSRSYAYQVLLLEEFSQAGVQTVFLKSAGGDSPEDRLVVQFQGMIAEYERAQIAERSRRGKRHRAKLGCVNVLSGAPYGYRYIRKTESTDAHYVVQESEAAVVREIFAHYTQDQLSIGAIARDLNQRAVPTRFGKRPWECSTVWGVLRNPAYAGRACFGKTQRAARQRITRPLRIKGGFSPRCSANAERPRADWIEIPVPALVSQEAFDLAQERLAENKRLSARRTKVPTLLQGLLVCGQCGYGLYRTSTKTTQRQVLYYRCLGSDAYRHLRGPVCTCRPIRQDYLDPLIWEEVLRLLEHPELVRNEIERQLRESHNSDPAQQRKTSLEKELKRVAAQLDKLLDAYQEDLLSLAELRRRAPELRRKQTTLEKELQGVALQALENQRLTQLNTSAEKFLSALKQSAQTLDVLERRKIIRLLIKEIIVHPDSLTIRHCLPVSGAADSRDGPSYPLCTRGNDPALRHALPVGQHASFAAMPLLYYGCVQPLAKQVQNAPIAQATGRQLQQALVRNRIEETYDTLPTSETFPPRSASHARTMLLKARCSKFSPSCGIKGNPISCWYCPTAAALTFPLPGPMRGTARRLECRPVPWSALPRTCYACASGWTVCCAG